MNPLFNTLVLKRSLTEAHLWTWRRGWYPPVDMKKGMVPTCGHEEGDVTHLWT